MSQQVKDHRARVYGSAVCLADVTGPDGDKVPVWSANPDEVLGWLCDGFRFRFNQRRSIRCPLTGPALGPAASAMNRKPPNAA
jgi:putative transposase